MLNKFDLIPEDFSYEAHFEKFKFIDLYNLKESPNNIGKKLIKHFNDAVNEDLKEPFTTEFDDLIRLHYIALNRKVTTVLEFGVGKSTLVFCDALERNSRDYFEFTSNNLRRNNLYECHSIDNSQSWIEECKKIIPNKFISSGLLNFTQSNINTSEFNQRVCTLYECLPNICPDLIYLDAPDQFSPKGNIRGISTKHKDRMPMAADILTFEHFLLPGTLIVVDGRTANARFLKSNLQRCWSHFHSYDWDQHFFELQEEPLGIYNEEMINHCLGEKYYLRIKN